MLRRPEIPLAGLAVVHGLEQTVLTIRFLAGFAIAVIEMPLRGVVHPGFANLAVEDVVFIKFIDLAVLDVEVSALKLLVTQFVAYRALLTNTLIIRKANLAVIQTL